MKAFIGGFLGFECKEGQKSPIIKIIFFQLDSLIQGYGWIEG